MRFTLFILLVICSSVFAAPPIVGNDCGFGGTATIVGTKEAGKVTLGDDPPTGSRTGCTLTFAWPGGKVPSCSAMLESVPPNPYNITAPWPAGTVTTATTLFIPDATFPQSMAPGYVVSYLCIGQ